MTLLCRAVPCCAVLCKPAQPHARCAVVQDRKQAAADDAADREAATRAVAAAAQEERARDTTRAARRQRHIDDASERAHDVRQRTRERVHRRRASLVEEEDRAAEERRAAVNEHEADRRRAGPVRHAQGKAAIDWGGTSAAVSKAAHEEARAAKTALARSKSFSNVVAKYAESAAAARESDREARALIRSIEAARIEEGAVRTAQGQKAIDWGGTEAAADKASFESARAAKTVLARTKSKTNALELRLARTAAEDRAAEERRAETNRWEARRRAEGPVRLAQGKVRVTLNPTICRHSSMSTNKHLIAHTRRMCARGGGWGGWVLCPSLSAPLFALRRWWAVPGHMPSRCSSLLPPPCACRRADVRTRC